MEGLQRSGGKRRKFDRATCFIQTLMQHIFLRGLCRRGPAFSSCLAFDHVLRPARFLQGHITAGVNGRGFHEQIEGIFQLAIIAQFLPLLDQLRSRQHARALVRNLVFQVVRMFLHGCADGVTFDGDDVIRGAGGSV